MLFQPGAVYLSSSALPLALYMRCSGDLGCDWDGIYKFLVGRFPLKVRKELGVDEKQAAAWPFDKDILWYLWDGILRM